MIIPWSVLIRCMRLCYAMWVRVVCEYFAIDQSRRDEMRWDVKLENALSKCRGSWMFVWIPNRTKKIYVWMIPFFRIAITNVSFDPWNLNLHYIHMYMYINIFIIYRQIDTSYVTPYRPRPDSTDRMKQNGPDAGRATSEASSSPCTTISLAPFE